MNKEWIEQERIRLEKVAEALKESIAEKIAAATFFTEKDKEFCFQKLDEMESTYYGDPFDSAFLYIDTLIDHKNETAEQDEEEYRQMLKWCKEVDSKKYRSVLEILKDKIYLKYEDSEPMKCDGDIIITDPGYITYSHKDWRLCKYGDRMERLGIKNYIVRSTLYGDWSCGTYNTDTNESLGEFCADSGLVGVFLLDEVLKYNPEFDYHIKRKWTTTWIQNFKGTIQYRATVVNTEDDLWHEANAFLEGHGINKLTGEPINFITSQTGW